MLVHTDHLVPGMRLDKDIELRAGSFLITQRELEGRGLDERLIQSIRKFSDQIVPVSHRIGVKEDLEYLRALRAVVQQDLDRVIAQVTEAKETPNYLLQDELEEKVLRVMETIVSNPDIIRVMYDSRFNSPSGQSPTDLVLEHSFRAALLSLAVGIQLGSTAFSLTSLGMAALLHDLSLLSTPFYSGERSLDELSLEELESFVSRHQIQSALYFTERDIRLSPYQKGEILHILASHHRPVLDERTHRSTLIFHFADLVDELISHLPHNVRYAFRPNQETVTGRRFNRRTGLVPVLGALAVIAHRHGGQVRQVIAALAELFGMPELMNADYARRLREIVDWCPYDSAALWPDSEGNSPPRAVFCRRSREDGFSCRHMVFTRIEVQQPDGSLLDYFKCAELGPRLQRLNEGE